MPTTTPSLLPYPAFTDAPSGPGAVQALADRIEALRAVEGRGKLPGGYAEVVANQTGITTQTDLTSLTATVTVGAGRRIRVTGFIYPSGIAGDGALVRILEGAATLQKRIVYFPVSATPFALPAIVSLTPSTGAHTYKLSLERAIASGGTVTNNAAADSPSFILVEDIGV